MHPIIFSFGLLHVYSYGAMVSLGIFTAVFLLRKHSKSILVTPDMMTDLAIATVVSGFAGARIFYVIQFWDYFQKAPLDIFKIWEGGIILYGGLIGGLAGFIAFIQLKRLSILKTLDLFVCATALAQGFGRLGCFLNGCCFGKPTDATWGIKFPFLNHPVHPTQIYESIFCFVLSGFLFWLWSKRPKTGMVTAVYFSIYAIGRFVIEFFRGDQTHYLFNLTLQQWISISTILLVLFFVSLYGKKRNYRSSRSS